jgi:UDP-N-acetylmuramate: L-alanyl-gamma-D-glutamyl-meso-diaminopimelate ligase
MKDLNIFPDAHLRIFERPSLPQNIESVYLVGICGTGMGSLAGLFQEAGFSVSGSDEAIYPPMSTRLEEMGIRLFQGFSEANLKPTPDLSIIGNSCTPTHAEAAYLRENALPQLNFPEALSQFFIKNRRSLVVTGTHGKTSTTGLLAHVFRSAQRDPGFLVGGVLVKDNRSFAVGSGNWFITEGDEYDSAYFDKQPKMWHYKPTVAIVTSMEFDHADIYADWTAYRKAFEHFASLISDTAILCGDHEAVKDLVPFLSVPHRFYGLSKGNHIRAKEIKPVDGGQTFKLLIDGESKGVFFLPLSGNHNLVNALGVIAVALHEGLSIEEIGAGLSTFGGMKRRQEVRGIVNDVVVIDDFAHHPTAVKETISAIKQKYPSRRLVAVFEPRSNSSRRKVFEKDYAKSFKKADVVFMSSPPFRHNDNAADFMNPYTIAEKLGSKGVPAFIHPDADAVLEDLKALVQRGDVVLMMSNGSFGGIHQKLLEALAS